MIKNACKVIPSILASLLIATPTFAASTVDKTEENDFTINLLEVLTVQVSSDKVSDTEQTNSVGDVFLKDFTQLHVQTNNASGFSATMTTKTTNTALKNTTDDNITIPTLTSNVTSEASFPVNKWGFSLNGSNASTAVYRPLVGSDSTTPSVIAKTTTGADSYTNIYFGTKGNATTTSGTYANTVVISVTAPPSASDDPVPPIDNPVEPVTPVNNNPAPSRAPARTIADTTDTEEPSAYDAHEEPQGVVEDTTETHVANSNSSMSLAAGTTVTAAAGLIFFILAKRKEDEDEETK